MKKSGKTTTFDKLIQPIIKWPVGQVTPQSEGYFLMNRLGMGRGSDYGVAHIYWVLFVERGRDHFKRAFLWMHSSYKMLSSFSAVLIDLGNGDSFWFL